MYKHKEIRVPRAGTHVKMHGIAKGPAQGPHVAKRLMDHNRITKILNLTSTSTYYIIILLLLQMSFI